ncbi:N-acetyltransferase domain-containing protein [Palleronia rufa]
MPQTDTALSEGQFSVPPGHLAVVVTHLICRTASPARAVPDGISLFPEPSMSPDAYRRLFTLIGRDWLWTSRLMLDDDALAAVLRNPDVALYTVRADSGTLGMMELDLTDRAVPQISFFGLTPDATGRGIGAWLMAHVQAMLFDGGAQAIRLNTCTLDSPHALRFYLGAGFEAERREVRVFPDPRALGLLDAAEAPHVPRI